jgi:hypothetical protein
MVSINQCAKAEWNANIQSMDSNVTYSRHVKWAMSLYQRRWQLQSLRHSVIYESRRRVHSK